MKHPDLVFGFEVDIENSAAPDLYARIQTRRNYRIGELNLSDLTYFCIGAMLMRNASVTR